MSVTRFAALRHSELYRPLSVLLVVALVALPTYGATGSRPQACQQAPGLVETRAASADAEFVRDAALQNLRPVGAAVALLDDGSSVVTSVATRQYQTKRSGALFLRRDVIYALGSAVPGMIEDIGFGMDPDRDVLWVKVTLSVTGDSSLKPASLQYDTEYRASELPAFQKLGAEQATALLKEWAATARPLSERATVVRDGSSAISEEGSGSFERAVESLVPSRDTTAPFKSRSSCRQGCAARYLGPYGTFTVACLVAGALVCMGVCYVTLGTACAACIVYLESTCGYLGSVVSIFQYLRCYSRC